MTLFLPPFATLTTKRVFGTWWPLAMSWLLMGVELPALSAVVARLSNPEINLAAYGGVVFPLALIVESPIIMLLAASTALSRDWDSYLKLHRFMMRAGFILTCLHILVAFTPLYDWLVVGLMKPPADIIEPARLGLMIMTPWTWSIAYRRFHQGVLIRFDHSQAVGYGTLIRLGANAIVLTIGFLSEGRIPGIAVATMAVASGVISEAVYIGLIVQPVLRNQVKPAPSLEVPLTFGSFVEFYIPLAMTSLLTLIALPIGSAALSRMPHALDSLAVWPVISGLMFMLRSPGIAYNEVVVALIGEPKSSQRLRRFTEIMAAVVVGLIFLIAATPLAHVWFQGISALSPALADLAASGLWFAIPLPGLAVLQSWYQGVILHSKRTQPVTEAVVVYLLTSLIIFGIGIILNTVPGLYIGVISLTISTLTQTIWLWVRSRGAMQEVRERDENFASAQPAPSPSAR
jgi:hypothetical protein